MQQAHLIFNIEAEAVKQYVNEGPSPFVTSLEADELYIYVKETKQSSSYDDIRMLAGDLSRYVQQRDINKVKIDEASLIERYDQYEATKVITAFIEGWELGAYQFDRYKQKQAAPCAKLQFKTEANYKDAIQAGKVRAAAMAFSRDLMNEIPSVLNPETFPKILQATFAQDDVKVVVHQKADLEEMEMNGLLAVNRGSKYDPAFIELHYEGDPSQPLIALVGKGVTFDTGGISLKGARNLSDMRMDMGGAAAVAGAIKLLADTKVKVNVVGLIQTVENMPDGQALLPGDIIKYKNGHTVQVGNTDAEGRLILADGLIRAGELKADYIIDIATLTGAIMMALGLKIGGIFGDEKSLQLMKEIGDENGDFVWPMPLVDAYDEMLKSDYADFCNISNKPEAGAITAALFLRRFIPENTKWVHVDMAGVMEGKTAGYYTNEGTGFGARLLADFAIEVSQGNRA